MKELRSLCVRRGRVAGRHTTLRAAGREEAHGVYR